jgi:hypothetical protein
LSRMRCLSTPVGSTPAATGHTGRRRVAAGLLYLDEAESVEIPSERLRLEEGDPGLPGRRPSPDVLRNLRRASCAFLDSTSPKSMSQVGRVPPNNIAAPPPVRISRTGHGSLSASVRKKCERSARLSAAMPGLHRHPGDVLVDSRQQRGQDGDFLATQSRRGPDGTCPGCARRPDRLELAPDPSRHSVCETIMLRAEPALAGDDSTRDAIEVVSPKGLHAWRSYSQESTLTGRPLVSSLMSHLVAS